MLCIPLVYIFIYIFIYIYIYLFIWCRGHPGYKDPSRRRGCSAAMKRACLSAAYACVVDHYRIPTSYSSTICRSPLSSAARRWGCMAIASSARPTMLCIPLVVSMVKHRPDQTNRPRMRSIKKCRYRKRTRSKAFPSTL